MKKFISVPTSVGTNTNILFNAESISSVNAPSPTAGNAFGAEGSTTTITTTSATTLTVGMSLLVFSGTGVFAPNTTVLSVASGGLSFTISAAPTTALTLASIVGYIPFCSVFVNNKIFRLTFNGSNTVAQNSNAALGADKINKAMLGTYSGPTLFNVVFDSGAISVVTVV